MSQKPFDFGGLGKVGGKKDKGPTDPIQIFERRPSVEGGFDDLWRGQAEALDTWNGNYRNTADTLVTLNTGAGKTVVGLLIAQSLVNEGVENVVYACATIDLVYQTAKEADLIGLSYSTRAKGQFSNDKYESGLGFCITTYNALFNGRSYFKRAKKPGAVIFDDAHVAEAFLRDAVTLRVDGSKDPATFAALQALFTAHFQEIGRAGEFKDATGKQYNSIVMASPGAVRVHAAEIDAIIKNAAGGADPHNYSFALGHLQDHFAACAVLFGNGVCEITPPFLPSLALPIFAPGTRRIYLSATLHSLTDFVRAFGRVPEIVIQPRNDAGNGERLILSGDKFGRDGAQHLVKTLVMNHKTLIAVPNYFAAKQYEDIAKPPDVDQFTDELNKFKDQTKPGAFVLVSRVDGIDLPHEVCRVMVMAGLPTGTALIERYLWEYIDLRNLCASKLANRIAQLFGRINRGRNDYGAFVTIGTNLTTWLSNDRNVALLPDLIQQQIALGRHVQASLPAFPDAARGVIDQVLSRDAGWMDFYTDNIEKRHLDPKEIERARESEKGLLDAALAAASYAKSIWEGDLAGARQILEETIEAVGRTDSRLAGWHNIWLGGALEAEGDMESAALSYRRAKSQLGVNYAPPHLANQEKQEEVKLSPFGTTLFGIAGSNSPQRYTKEVAKLRRLLSDLDGGSFRQMEAAVRELGELIGFESTRPDNDLRTGPDVLWISRSEGVCLPIELKTEKEIPPLYSKSDIKDGHDHLSFVANEHAGTPAIGLLFVGPLGKVAEDANPNPDMWLAEPTALMVLRERVFAILEDVRKLPPLERRLGLVERCNGDEWTLNGVLAALGAVKLLE